MKNGFKIFNTKTKCIIYKIYKMHIQSTWTLNGSKFLSIALDPKLSFVSHIKQLRTKYNQII